MKDDYTLIILKESCTIFDPIGNILIYKRLQIKKMAGTFLVDLVRNALDNILWIILTSKRKRHMKLCRNILLAANVKGMANEACF